MYFINIKFDGCNMFFFKDVKGNELYKMIVVVGVLLVGKGFFEYWWLCFGSDKLSFKMGFVKCFKFWNWDLICSVYFDDIEVDFCCVLVQVVVVLVVLGVLLFIIVGLVLCNIFCFIGGEFVEVVEMVCKIVGGDFIGIICISGGDQYSLVVVVVYMCDCLVDIVQGI